MPSRGPESGRAHRRAGPAAPLRTGRVAGCRSLAALLVPPPESGLSTVTRLADLHEAPTPIVLEEVEPALAEKPAVLQPSVRVLGHFNRRTGELIEAGLGQDSRARSGALIGPDAQEAEQCGGAGDGHCVVDLRERAHHALRHAGQAGDG
jgi:hypothetical protein